MNKPKALKAYRKEKVRILRDFGIPVTIDIVRNMNERETEIAIDNYCHNLIANFLDR